MIPTELVTGQSLVLLGLAVVVFVFVLRRTVLRMRKGAAVPADDDDFAAAEAGAVRATEMLEVRLHDFAREVEGRMLARIAVLDRLIVEADREIVRLRDLLRASNGEGPSGESRAAASSSRQPDALVPLPPQAGAGFQKDAA